MLSQLEEKLDQALEGLMKRSMRSRLTYGRPFGLRGLEALALETLLKQQTASPAGEVSPTQLSAAMEMRAPVVSPVISSLEERGYIQSRRDEKDRRCRWLTLSPPGREVAENLLQNKQEHCHRLSAFLGERDAGELTRLLLRLSDFEDQNVASSRQQKRSEKPNA